MLHLNFLQKYASKPNNWCVLTWCIMMYICNLCIKFYCFVPNNLKWSGAKRITRKKCVYKVAADHFVWLLLVYYLIMLEKLRKERFKCGIVYYVNHICLSLFWFSASTSHALSFLHYWPYLIAEYQFIFKSKWKGKLLMV